MKNFLKEAGVFLIGIAMVLSTIVVAANSGTVIFSQPPIPDDASGGAYYSDAGYGTFRIYDNFWGITEDIHDVHWWGVFDQGSYEPAPGDEFEISFCADNGGIPDYGNPTAVFTGSIGSGIICTGTGVYYWGDYELYYMEMDLPSSVSMSNGWVSFYKTTVNDQWFAIIESLIGDDYSFQLAGETILPNDFAFELTNGESELSVDVDIKPGSCPNPIKVGSKGVIPVAILGTAEAAGIDDSLCTIFAANNAQAGNMFDVKALNDITITSFDVSIDTWSEVMEVWYRPGSYIGHETSSSGWTLLGTAAVTGLGFDVPTPCPIGGLSIPAGETYGIYVTCTLGNHIDYTNGDGTNQFYSNSDMEITLGKGGSYFSVTFDPRVWNGCIYYSSTDGFDVMDIDPDTITLEGVSPLRWSYEDVATPYIPPACEWEICLYDSFGDGWNDNYIDVYINGVLEHSGVTLESGAGPYCMSFSVNDGDSIFIDYIHAGGWPDENSYEIIDSEGSSALVTVVDPFGDSDWSGTGYCPELCGCHELGPDGYMDLNLKFKTQELVAALGDVNDGDVLTLRISGYLFDGTPFEGTDCVWIIDK